MDRAIGQRHRARIRIDLVQQQPVAHVEAGVAHDDLSLELEQQHVDGLYQRCELGGQARSPRGNRLIGGIGERHELAQGYAVIVLEDLVVAVAQVVA